VEVCPRNAISVEGETPVIDMVSCNGCGACVSACPKGALLLPNYTKEAILEEVAGLAEGAEDVVVIGFYDDNISYTAADNAGTARIHSPTNIKIVRTPSTAILDKETVIRSLGLGADGIMICEIEDSHEEGLAEKLVEKARGELEGMGVEPERVHLRPMVLPIFKVLPQFITDYTATVRKLGRIPEEKRKELLEWEAASAEPQATA